MTATLMEGAEESPCALFLKGQETQAEALHGMQQATKRGRTDGGGSGVTLKEARRMTGRQSDHLKAIACTREELSSGEPHGSTSHHAGQDLIVDLHRGKPEGPRGLGEGVDVREGGPRACGSGGSGTWHESRGGADGE